MRVTVLALSGCRSPAHTRAWNEKSFEPTGTRQRLLSRVVPTQRRANPSTDTLVTPTSAYSAKQSNRPMKFV